MLLFSSTSAPAAETAAPDPLSQLGDCNWQVTYRGRTYDLAPLTREALTRPIENDIRYALQRVPESSAHLDSMSGKLQQSRVYTILASAFLVGFVVTRAALPQSGEAAQARKNLVSGLIGGLSLSSLFMSWRSTRGAKEELVSAVRTFNEHSPHKIEPALQGDAQP